VTDDRASTSLFFSFELRHPRPLFLADLFPHQREVIMPAPPVPSPRSYRLFQCAFFSLFFLQFPQHSPPTRQITTQDAVRHWYELQPVFVVLPLLNDSRAQVSASLPQNEEIPLLLFLVPFLTIIFLERRSRLPSPPPLVRTTICLFLRSPTFYTP